MEYRVHPRDKAVSALRELRRDVRQQSRAAFDRWRLLALFHLETQIRRKTPIIIYQMARVGSTAIWHGAQRQGVSPVFHLHVLQAERLISIYPRPMPNRRLEMVYAEFQREAACLGPTLVKHIVRRGRPVKLIAPVREPIARNVSLFFHMLHVAGMLPAQLSLAELTRRFLQTTRHATALTWFDDNVRGTLGIDVYAYPFPREQGLLTIRQDNIELLVFKAELDDARKAQAIAEFLELPSFRLARENGMDATPHQHIYRQFVREAQLPIWYIEAMYRTRYMRHFYSMAEIHRLRNSWLSATSEDASSAAPGGQ